MDASPSKRRVLAPIDGNTRIPAVVSKLDISKSQPSPAKRPLELETTTLQPQQLPSTQPIIKRQRVSVGEDSRPTVVDEEREVVKNSRDDDETSNSNSNGDEEVEQQQQRSDSPDEESSLFDTSAVDTTQDTTLTEPDAEAVAPTPTPPRPRRGTMTREEARRSAETLRLRLGLASYKVRTGQTDVPLEQLKVKPLLPTARRGEPSLPPLPAPRNAGATVAEGDGKDDENGSTDEGQHDGAEIVARKALPTAPSGRPTDTLGSGHPAPERRLLPELAASALSVQRKS
ncbi:hypothetical protein F5Y04DRAFT_261526 [Hypomontagnella monticulosa]|nr:hypothetical protein F5Y04DRAFT_261526 [Hypomontagnella monticulosa]